MKKWTSIWWECLSENSQFRLILRCRIHRQKSADEKPVCLLFGLYNGTATTTAFLCKNLRDLFGPSWAWTCFGLLEIWADHFGPGHILLSAFSLSLSLSLLWLVVAEQEWSRHGVRIKIRSFSHGGVHTRRELHQSRFAGDFLGSQTRFVRVLNPKIPGEI